MVGLKPAEFELLQPGEFNAYIEGQELAQKEMDLRRSYFVAWILAPHCKKPPKPQDLYDGLWLTEADRQAQTREDFEILKREFGLEEEV